MNKKFIILFVLFTIGLVVSFSAFGAKPTVNCHGKKCTTTSTTTPTTTSISTTVPTTTGTTTGNGGGVFDIPSDIASDCSTDVTSQILAWINTVPDNSTLSFGVGACYRIEGTIELRSRTGLDFEGNESTFRSFNPAEDQRPLWRLWNSNGLQFNGMNLVGSYSTPGTFVAGVQHAHGFDLRGTNAIMNGDNISNVGGDCVYFGLSDNGTTRSSGTVLNSTCTGTGRNGISVVAGDNVLVQGSSVCGTTATTQCGYEGIDVEPNAPPAGATCSGGSFGDNHGLYTQNTLGSNGNGHSFSVVQTGPICDQEFSDNNVLADDGFRSAIGGSGYRPNNIRILRNSSPNKVPTGHFAVNADDVDTLSVKDNTAPITDSTYVQANTSTDVCVSGNNAAIQVQNNRSTLSC